MTEESAVKVCVRVRPLIAREESATSEIAEPVQLFWKADRKSIHQVDDGNSSKSFSFDRVFIAEETTNQLYQDIAKPLVVSTVEGYNGTIFAYGQTSSGKTFTMMGSDRIPGVIPLAVEDVFQTIKNCPKKEFLLRVSYMEIYNETVTDLLVDSWKRKPLEVRETINKNIYVADLTEELVTSPAQALAWIRKGEKNRHYGKTKMNQRSSRSHTIFRMILESRERSDPVSGENADGAIIVSHLNLVDLAGSERASQTGAEGTRFKEGCNINRSLFTLGQVIKKLTDEGQKGFTNYRDSKLTRILQNSLGGNAKTVIICTITPVTLDETLSTLQFASTAKKMKNDPHVTEVSDDGALLKRYRNEIVDLKRRLQEVSSVTQTTATEKEVLSQLLQEKDQLQREQEDRIKNLTKLLVTSSNPVPVQRMPKRRVTWGGKMLRLARPSNCEGSPSNHSFAESVTRKRKAERSCLMELMEDDEEFDSQWEIPDEPSDDMDISPSLVTVRSIRNSLEGRVSELELQLQTLDQQKQEALETVLATEQRAAELDLQLKTEIQQKLEATEKVEALELRVADLGRFLEEQGHEQAEASKQIRTEFAETVQLCETLATEKDMVVGECNYLKQELGMFIEQTESLEREKAALLQELEEKKEMDEFKHLEAEFRKEHENELQNEISSLKMALESRERQCSELQKNLETVSMELRKKSEIAEDLQTLNGKDLVQEVVKLRRSLDDAEGLSRDTKKEWAMLRSQNIALEEMKVTLTADHEKMKAELHSLRSQLEAEKSHYRKMQSDLQKELNIAFDENTKLTTLLDGKVPHNLMDSLDLERKVTNLNKEIAACHDREGALRAQLEELTPLQALPNEVNNLMKQVSQLTEELSDVQTQRDSLLSLQAVSQEEVHQLRDRLQTSQEEVLKIQDELRAAVDRENDLKHTDAEKCQLMATIEEKALKLEERDQQQASLEEELKEAHQLVSDFEERLAHSEVSRNTEEEISKELQEQLDQLNEELQCLRAEKNTFLSERNVQSSTEEMEKLLSTITSLTAERDQLQMDLQENVQMAAETQGLLHSLQEELKEQKQKNFDLVKHNEQKESDLKDNIQKLSLELQTVREARETHQTADAHSSTEEMERLLSAVSSLAAERDQVKMDLQENIEMMIENQEELRVALDKNCKHQQRIKELETQRSNSKGPTSDLRAQLEELQRNTNSLTEELESVKAERDSLQSEMEKLLSRVTSLNEERDQLQEILEGLRQEKNHLRAELEDRMAAQAGFSQPEMLNSPVEPHDERITQLQQEKSYLEAKLQQNTDVAAGSQSLLHSLQEQLQEQSQRNIDLERLGQERQAQLEQQVTETQMLLQSLREEFQEQKQKNSDLVKLSQERECDLEQRLKTAAEELECIQTERDSLLFDKETGRQTSSEEMEKLLGRVTSLSEERDQLQETLEGLRQEKKQLQAELEEQIEMIQCEFQQQLSSEPHSLKEEQEAEQRRQVEQLEEHLEKSKKEVSLLKADLEENVELMIENQGELRVAQEKICILQEEINMLRSQKAELESRTSRGSDIEKTEYLEELQLKIQMLTAELESMKVERDALQSESTAEREKLSSRAVSLSEEMDQQQEILEGLRQEKNQLRAELEDRMATQKSEIRTLTEKLESAEIERDVLLAEKDVSHQSSAEEIEKLTCRVTSLFGEKEQLQKMLEELRLESDQLRTKLEEIMETLQTEKKTLTETLGGVVAERDSLLLEKESSHQTSTKELESLQSRVTSLSYERDQLQETLEGLREEKNQLQEEVDNKMNTISTIQEKLTEQKQFNSQLQADTQEREGKLQQEVQQLEEQLKTSRGKQTLAEAEAQQLLIEANTTISVLKEQLSTLDQSTSGVKKTVSSRLEDSTLQLQETFRKFQHFIDTCSKYDSTAMVKALSGQSSLKYSDISWLPKPTVKAYEAVGQLGLQSLQSLGNIGEHLQVCAKLYRNLFEKLVKTDLGLYEERRLQDVLLCRAQAPIYSIKDEDFSTLWEHRLTDLLNNRQQYLQKMGNVLEKLWANLASYPSELSAEVKERERFQEQLQAAFTNQPTNFSELDSLLSCELDRRSAVAQKRKMTLQGIIDEHNVVCAELKQLETQTESQLTEERSKRLTLHQALEGAPLKTELSLLKDNQQLVLHLQQAEEKLHALHVQNEQLEEAQVKAEHRVSNHKQATQLLQTELQDSRAQVEEKENAIQILKSKLRESEMNASPSAMELEKFRTKVFKMEVELSSASDKHKQEIQRMTTVLKEKEETVRKLKETLRKSQEQGEGSFLQGEDLHARLTNPRGLVIKSSILLEKNKLEEDIKQLQLKITELESLVSSQQQEISKWKSRAIKLKTKGEVEKPSSPCTPTKRGFPLTSDSLFNSPKKFLVTPKKILDSPRKPLDSPKVSVLDSPKSSFFDVGGSSKLLSRNCPKQFFDNSNLGTLPEISQAPDWTNGVTDAAAAAAAGNKEWWPQSPKEEEMCRTQ
ncbi:centromere-associated protein E [Aulostomus maculatus]